MTRTRRAATTWEAIRGQELAKRTFQVHLASGEVYSAYLLAGPAGIGKRLLAHAMARALNCTQEGARPCGACPTCRQIEKHVHPDVHWLVPEGAAGLIKIESVRRVLARAALRPFVGRYQVIIIDGADRMTEEAANSLLKSLEEPSARTRYLLISTQLSGCLPTIVSRCQILRCQRLSPVVVEEILVAGKVADAPTARVVARLANGSVAQAIELVARWPEYQQMITRFDPTRVAAWLEEPLPETRADVQHLLEGMMAWLRDVALVQEGQAALAAHQQAEEALRQTARQFDPDRALETLFELLRLRESLDQFVSPRLVAALVREHWLNLFEGCHV